MNNFHTSIVTHRVAPNGYLQQLLNSTFTGRMSSAVSFCSLRRPLMEIGISLGLNGPARTRLMVSNYRPRLGPLA